MGEVINYTYQELKEKTASALELLLKNIKIHSAFVNAMADAGVITKDQASKDDQELVKKIIELIKEEYPL